VRTKFWTETEGKRELGRTRLGCEICINVKLKEVAGYGHGSWLKTRARSKHL
jgi:hypothetical protein